MGRKVGKSSDACRFFGILDHYFVGWLVGWIERQETLDMKVESIVGIA
jgi:hypothetical protein